MGDLLPAVGFPLLYAAPWLIVLVVGFVLFLTRRERLPSRARSLGMTGCALLALSSLGTVASNVWAVTAAARGSSITEAVALSGLVNAGLVLVGAAGLALLVAAALSGRAIVFGAGPRAYAAHPPPMAWPPPGAPGYPPPPAGWPPPGPHAGAPAGSAPRAPEPGR